MSKSLRSAFGVAVVMGIAEGGSAHRRSYTETVLRTSTVMSIRFRVSRKVVVPQPVVNCLEVPQTLAGLDVDGDDRL